MNDSKSDWSLTRGVPRELPTVVALYEVQVLPPDKVRVSFKVGQEKDLGSGRSRAVVKSALKDLESSAPDASEGWSQMWVTVYSDGDYQTVFSPSESRSPKASMARLIKEGLRGVAVKALFDPSIKELKRGREKDSSTHNH